VQYFAGWRCRWTATFAFTLSGTSNALDPELFKYLSPLGWEHINLTVDYQWKSTRLAQGRFRPLRTPNHP
jgi:hypothetical protein